MATNAAAPMILRISVSPLDANVNSRNISSIDLTMQEPFSAKRSRPGPTSHYSSAAALGYAKTADEAALFDFK
jgi:hypothetical protein